MLEVILVCAIFGFIIYLLSKRFKLKISKATDAESAVRIRKYFRIYRIIVKVLFVIIMLLSSKRVSMTSEDAYCVFSVT